MDRRGRVRRAFLFEFPSHWADGMHLEHEHGLRVKAEDCTVEDMLHGDLSALLIRDGVEYGSDDVSGAYLDPCLVAETRAVEMTFFNDMSVYERVGRQDMIHRGGRRRSTR